MAFADLHARDPVHVFPEEYLLTLPIEPKFHAFKWGPGNEAAEDLRRRTFEDRGGDGFATDFPAAGTDEEE